MPQPDENHARMTALAGRWVGEEKMPPSPWLKDGAIGEAELVNRVGAGGFALTQDYVQRRGEEITFQGHGVFWFDRKSGEQRLHWWDSMGMAPDRFRGRWEGACLTLHSEGPMGHTRATWVVDGDRYTHTMEMSPDGEDWKVVMDGAHRRVPPQ